MGAVSRPTERRSALWAWLGPIACAMAVVGFVAFYVTTQFSFEFHADDAGSGFSFNAGNAMSLPFNIGLIVWFVAGASMGIAGAVRSPRSAWVGWTGAAIDGLLAVLLAIFLAVGIAQGGDV